MPWVIYQVLIMLSAQPELRIANPEYPRISKHNKNHSNQHIGYIKEVK